MPQRQPKTNQKKLETKQATPHKQIVKPKKGIRISLRDHDIFEGKTQDMCGDLIANFLQIPIGNKRKCIVETLYPGSCAILDVE